MDDDPSYSRKMSGAGEQPNSPMRRRSLSWSSHPDSKTFIETPSFAEIMKSCVKHQSGIQNVGQSDSTQTNTDVSLHVPLKYTRQTSKSACDLTQNTDPEFKAFTLASMLKDGKNTLVNQTRTIADQLGIKPPENLQAAQAQTTTAENQYTRIREEGTSVDGPFGAPNITINNQFRDVNVIAPITF